MLIGAGQSMTDFVMGGLRPPPTLVFDSTNLSKTCESWREEFILYTDLTIPGVEETTSVKLFNWFLQGGGLPLCGAGGAVWGFRVLIKEPEWQSVGVEDLSAML